MLRFLVATTAILFGIGVVIAACQPTTPPVPDSSVGHKVKGVGPPGSANQTASYSYVSGTDGGTVTVPSGNFVTAIWVSGAATFTITPSGPNKPPTCAEADAGFIDVDGGCPDGALLEGGACDGGVTLLDGGPVFTGICTATGSIITVPSGGFFDLGASGNGLRGAYTELGDNSQIVFATGTTFYVGLNAY